MGMALLIAFMARVTGDDSMRTRQSTSPGATMCSSVRDDQLSSIGDKVEPGQPVAVMEAMKMENILRAPKAATVKATPAKAGDSLAVDQVIVEFE